MRDIRSLLPFSERRKLERLIRDFLQAAHGGHLATARGLARSIVDHLQNNPQYIEAIVRTKAYSPTPDAKTEAFQDLCSGVYAKLWRYLENIIAKPLAVHNPLSWLQDSLETIARNFGKDELGERKPVGNLLRRDIRKLLKRDTYVRRGKPPLVCWGLAGCSQALGDSEPSERLQAVLYLKEDFIARALRHADLQNPYGRLRGKEGLSSLAQVVDVLLSEAGGLVPEWLLIECIARLMDISDTVVEYEHALLPEDEEQEEETEGFIESTSSPQSSSQHDVANEEQFARLWRLKQFQLLSRRHRVVLWLGGQEEGQEVPDVRNGGILFAFPNDSITLLLARYPPSPRGADPDILYRIPEELISRLQGPSVSGLEIAGILGITGATKKDVQDAVADARRAAGKILTRQPQPRLAPEEADEYLPWLWLWTRVWFLAPLPRLAWLLGNSDDVLRQPFHLGRCCQGGPHIIREVRNHIVPMVQAKPTPIATDRDIAHWLLLTTNEELEHAHPDPRKRFCDLLLQLVTNPRIQQRYNTKRIEKDLKSPETFFPANKSLRDDDKFNDLLPALWSALPLGDGAIGSILGVPEYQVTSLRTAAWRQLDEGWRLFQFQP